MQISIVDSIYQFMHSAEYPYIAGFLMIATGLYLSYSNLKKKAAANKKASSDDSKGGV